MTKTKSKGIVAWPEGERPRERLMRQGAQSLTDTELVAILLRVGVQGTSAVELARQVLKKFGSLRAVAGVPLSALLEVKGLKVAKAAQLAAAYHSQTHESESRSRKHSQQLLDHIIVGEDSVFSFADSGMMDEIALAGTTG